MINLIFYSYPPHFFIQSLNFGFFNYAGIDRQVRLYTTPLVYVSDVRVVTDFTNNGGKLLFTFFKWDITQPLKTITSSNIIKRRLFEYYPDCMR